MIREPPLALYVYSSKKAEIEKILRNTQSGGVCINECLLHQAGKYRKNFQRQRVAHFFI